MAQTAWIPVEVKPGMFQSERSVSFEAGGQPYSLIVDQSDVQDGKLRVRIIEHYGGEMVIDLPRDTFTSGNRIRVPEGYVQME
jgi:hypothetical protein